MLNKIAEKLRKSFTIDLSNHPALILAEQSNNSAVLNVVATALTSAYEALISTADALEKIAESNNNISETFLDEMAAIATEFDKSEDLLLKKQAAVLDHILTHMSVPNGILWSLKQADNQEIDRIRQKRREEVYDDPRKILADEMKRSDVVKAIDNSVKSYRPMQHSLSTRYCPDHPGASLMRVGDNVFQCNLDRKIYDFKSGFTLLNGDKVPGGDVSGQTRFINDPIANNMSFSTRESVLNN